MTGPCATCSGRTQMVKEFSVVVSFFILWIVSVDIEGWAISPRGAGYLFGGNIMDQVGVWLVHRKKMVVCVCVCVHARTH